MSKAILITGATGKQGGAVLRQLATGAQSSQFTLLPVTRNTSSGSAQSLAKKFPDAILVQGDLNDTPSLFKSAQSALKAAGKPESIWGVFSVQISLGPGASFDGEIQQGKSLIDEALSHGVKHFVYSSVERGGNEKSLDDPTSVPHFQTKQQIEKHLVEKGGVKGEKMGWTILRPVAFMDNLEPGMQTKVFLTAMRNTLKEKPMQWVSVEDIGLFAAKAFENPDKWNARAEGLAGDELTFDELHGSFQRAVGTPAPTTYSFLGSALMYAVKEVNHMLTWFATDGYKVDIAKLKQEEPRLCNMEKHIKERSGFKAAA